MSESYETARKWADKFIGRQCKQLASLLNVSRDDVVLSDLRDDFAGVDARVGTLRIALRVRRHDKYVRFGLQPTFRTSVGKDGRNELDKIRHGSIDYMLLNYSTEHASEDNEDDSCTASIFIDLGPFGRAAEADFAGVSVTPLEADRVHGLAVDLATLMARYGDCVVAQHCLTSTSSSVSVEVNNTATTGMIHRTDETASMARVHVAHNPKLLETARKRVKG